VPHSAQKPRSAIEELANIFGAPRIQINSAIRAPAKAMNGAPPAFWHMRQWQMFEPVGSASRR
jgi:hypothetical protein